MSEHECPVIQIKLEKHPGADSLSLVRDTGFTIVVKTSEWKNGDLAICIHADYVCPDTEQFKFLGNNKRIKPRRFCGIWSDGILIKAPEGLKEGDNAIDILGIKRYDPEIKYSMDDENESGPSLFSPIYNIENYKKYKNIFSLDDEIVVHEKIHGCNSRWVYHNGRMWCGSHRNWKKYNENNLWWKALKLNKWVEKWCIDNENKILYSECYGQVQDLKYGTSKNELKIVIFDILYNKEYLNYDEPREIGKDLLWCPELYRGNINENEFYKLSNGDSSINGANHMREGIVIKTTKEKYNNRTGRTILKLVSSRYLSS